MKDRDDNDCWGTNRINKRVENKGEQLDKIIAISVSKVKLRKLIKLIILYLEEIVVLEKTISEFSPKSLDFPIYLEKV